MGLPVDATTLLFLNDQRAAAAAAQKTLQQRQMWALQDASATSAATRRAATSTSTLQLLQLQEAQQQRRLQEQLYGSSVAAPAPRYGNTSAAALLQRLQDEQLMQQQQQQLLAAEGEYERQNQLAQLLASARGSGASSAVSGVDANLLLRRRLQELEYERRTGVAATISPTSSSASLSQRLASYSSKASAASGVASMPVHAAGTNDKLAPWSSTSAGILGNLALEKGSNHSDPLLGRTKKFQKKPKDQPTRALSAYNIFFKEERQRLLARLPGRSDEAAAATEADTPAGASEEAPAEAPAAVEPESRSKRKKNPHGKISFEGLAKAIGRKWQSLGPTDVAYYKQKSEDDKKRYRDEMDAYVSKKRQAIVLESSNTDVATTAGGSEQDPIAISEGSASKRCKLE